MYKTLIYPVPNPIFVKQSTVPQTNGWTVLRVAKRNLFQRQMMYGAGTGKPFIFHKISFPQTQIQRIVYPSRSISIHRTGCKVSPKGAPWDANKRTAEKLNCHRICLCTFWLLGPKSSVSAKMLQPPSAKAWLFFFASTSTSLIVAETRNPSRQNGPNWVRW